MNLIRFHEAIQAAVYWRNSPDAASQTFLLSLIPTMGQEGRRNRAQVDKFVEGPAVNGRRTGNQSDFVCERQAGRRESLLAELWRNVTRKQSVTFVMPFDSMLHTS